MFDSLVTHSIMKRASAKGLVQIRAHDLRKYTRDRHKTCDDKPFGGGPGMLMKPEPVFDAVRRLFKPRALKKRVHWPKGTRFVYLTPQGQPFSHEKAEVLSSARHLIFLCGHYEGVDQRVVDVLVTDELSIGDYVLTGGELPAMVVIDAVVRLVRGVLGREASKEFESFSQNLLEYPQYTRPAVYRGLKVPSVLLSGNHQAIETWRKREAEKRTFRRRPDLLKLRKG